MIVASRAVHNQATQEDSDYDVITAYVMEDNNSVVQENDLHSGPPSIKVITKRFVLLRVHKIGYGCERIVLVYSRCRFINILDGC
jgi:hypothetical protein